MTEPNLLPLYHQWVTEYYHDVYRWCYRYTKDAEESKDLTQETFLAVFRHLHQFRFESSPKTWLLTIAFRLCVKSEKRRKTRTKIAQSPTASSTSSSAESEYLKQSSEKAVWQVIDSLSPYEKMAMILYYDDHMSYEEISIALSKPISQVKNNLYRARQHVKKHLEREGWRE